MKTIAILTALFCTTLSFGQSFTDDFSVNTGLTSSFNRTLGGVSFTYTFKGDGDGGDFAWENNYGFNGTASINAASTVTNNNTTEKITITRGDAGIFTFKSIFINNTAGTTVAVAGYLGGSMVGSAKTVNTGASATLTFPDITIDEVRITATEFFNTNIDQFVGSTATGPITGLVDNSSINSNVILSPNPTNDHLTISGIYNAKSYVIYSALGDKVLEGNLDDSQKIRVEGLSKGAYILKLDNDKSMNFIKL